MTEPSQFESAAPVHATATAAGPTVIVSEKPDTKKAKESESSFAISVDQVFDGPLDLLLDLIRKQDIDIYDIPIARITAQYLGYVEKIRQLDSDQNEENENREGHEQRERSENAVARVTNG